MTKNRWIKKRQEHEFFASYVLEVPGGMVIRSIATGAEEVAMAMVFVPCDDDSEIEAFIDDWTSER